MKEIANLRNPSPEISQIFDCVIKNKFNDSTYVGDLRNEIRTNFFKNNLKDFTKEKERLAYLKIISDYDFSDEKNYEILTSDKKSLFSLMNTLSKFKENVLSHVKYTYDKTIVPTLMTHQESLPIEAYDLIGHSKLNIKPGREFTERFLSKSLSYCPAKHMFSWAIYFVFSLKICYNTSHDNHIFRKTIFQDSARGDDYCL